MKRGAGYFALFAFLVTGLRLASGPASMREAAGVRAEEKIAVMPGTFVREETTCQAFESPPAGPSKAGEAEQNPNKNGEIARLIDRFLYGSAQKQKLTPGELPPGIRLMLVTVPDPRHTHLSLQFDRTLEAVQQAAQDERYTYDSSWLPWKTDRIEYGSLSDRNAENKEAAEREVCPGLILFRKSMSGSARADCRDAAGAASHSGDAPYECGLFVFVVGEEPTAGLNRIQWDNALHWIDGHASKSRPDKALRILGPNFSGSMPSFVRALEDTGMYAGTFTSTLLYSGRIRGCASWRWLNRQLHPAPSSGAPPTTVKLPVRAADFEENDALQTDRLYRYLKDRSYRLSEIAIISEDETAYGGLPDAAAHSSESEPGDNLPCNPEYHESDRPVHLYYPRDISALRSAYQEQSIFSAGGKSDGTSSQPHTVLRPESSSGVHEDTDTIAPFSGNDLALTQEAQLYGIVNTLKTHGIRYIVLRSTNSLDYLFLTRFMHRAYPTAYIVTMGSDLLFAREVDSTEFRGVVSLSSFPLLPRGQDWTRQLENVPQHAHRIFGAYTMEGAYLAGRFVITDPGVSPEEAQSRQPFRHPAKADIPDYALPFWESERGTESADAEPATWLAVIGRDGYWPLATLKDTLGNTKRFSNLAIVERDRNHAAASPQDEVLPQHLSLTGSWRFLCVLAILIFGLHYFACRYGWDRQDLGMFVQFTRLHGRRGQGLIAAGWTSICCLLLILFLTCARIFRFLTAGDQGWVFLLGGATVAACVLALIELRWWNAPGANEAASLKRSERERLRFHRLVTGSMFAGIVLFGAAGWLILEFGRESESGVTTAYRSAHIMSGVSPVVPLVAVLAGFYWWFWQSLSGLALLSEGRPVLPRSPRERERNEDNQLARSIEQAALPFPNFGKSTLLLYLLPLFLILLLSIVLQKAWMQAFDMILHSLENTAYNRTLHVLIGIGLYLILLECMQLYSTWLVLKRLLVALDRVPLRRTFAAMQGLSMRSLWRMSGAGSRARAKVFSLQMESLSHLDNELHGFEWRNCWPGRLRDSVRTTWDKGRGFIQKRNEGKDLAVLNTPESKAIRLIFRECAEIVTGELLEPEWREERCSLEVQEPSGEGERPHERIRLSNNMPVRAGEEFVCLTYVGYLQNLLGRMRTMVLSVVGLFAAIALAVGFYPFTPRPTISLALLFLLLAIGSVVGLVFAGLDRDSTLSHITNTTPGSLGSHFWLRMLSFIGVPAMGLIVAQFPEITDFVFSWIAPTVGQMK
jgi:hypothetical protein